ncbi:MAG: U32 family peptidase [Lachnospiraceae bacterium]|nr:U32 family peptidase [Lachnospiraceae bacterium]
MEQGARVELLAPAGNKEGFYGAIHAGADAVYLGGSRFGARAYAENFTEEDLTECIRYAHLWGRKVYLTVNTLVKEAEFGELSGYLKPYYEAGLDGVIVQDIGVLAFLQETFPGMELHASTQMTLTGTEGVRLLQEMGVCRVVPARELSLREISAIKQETGVDIECFIHGAMCYCYSGQCLFSSILGGRSGNRGRCAQPCRLPYRVISAGGKSKECFPLSLKDMCTIEHIPELIEAGIDSFKIEGRMKKPEYAAGVTAIYRKYIDAYYAIKAEENQRNGQQTAEAPSKWKISSKDLEALGSLYIRSERQDGYYYKHNGRDMVTLDSPAYSKNKAELLDAIRQEYLEKRPRRPVRIRGTFLTGSRAKLEMWLEDSELSVTVLGDPVQVAGKQPVTEENIRRQLGKLGDSIFEIGTHLDTDLHRSAQSMELHVSEDAFYPLGAINALRREAVWQLEEKLIAANGLTVRRRMPKESADKHPVVLKSAQTNTLTDAKDRLPAGATSYILSVHTMEQLDGVFRVVQSNGNVPGDSKGRTLFKRIYINSDLLWEREQETIAKCREMADTQKNASGGQISFAVAFPYIIRKQDQAYLDRLFGVLTREKRLFTGVLIRNLEGMGALKSCGYRGEIYADSGFYIWNRKTLKTWADSICGFTLPVELRSGEQRELLSPKESDFALPSCEKLIYGRIPMMVTANCVANTVQGCRKGHNGGHREPVLFLEDRYNKRFPVEYNCIHCLNLIYNSVPLSLHGEWSKWEGKVWPRIDLTVEDGKETRKVLDFFLNGGNKPPFQEYTTGHEKRGVE